MSDCSIVAYQQTVVITHNSEKLGGMTTKLLVGSRHAVSAVLRNFCETHGLMLELCNFHVNGCVFDINSAVLVLDLPPGEADSQHYFSIDYVPERLECLEVLADAASVELSRKKRVYDELVRKDDVLLSAATASKFVHSNIVQDIKETLKRARLTAKAANAAFKSDIDENEKKILDTGGAIAATEARENRLAKEIQVARDFLGLLPRVAPPVAPPVAAEIGLECGICMERPARLCLIPCGHCYCAVCVEKLPKTHSRKKCPTCRGKVAHEQTLFF